MAGGSIGLYELAAEEMSSLSAQAMHYRCRGPDAESTRPGLVPRMQGPKTRHKHRDLTSSFQAPIEAGDTRNLVL